MYTLRHVFRTVADAAKDQPAADHIMGQETPNMAAVYRDRIADDRLHAVSDHVRKWLFAGKADAKGTSQADGVGAGPRGKGEADSGDASHHPVGARADLPAAGRHADTTQAILRSASGR